MFSPVAFWRKKDSPPPMIVVRNSTNDLYYSNDGVNFQEGKNTTGAIGTIIYSPDLDMFIAADLNSPWEIHRSTDGINWISAVSPGSTTRGVRGSYVFDGEIYLNRTSNVIKSSDGINWTTFNRNDTASGNGIAVNSNIIIAATDGSTTQRLQSSPTGATWTNRVDLGGIQGFVDWIENFGLFIAAAPGSSSFFTSTDGISWTTRTVPSKGTSNGRYPTWAYSPKLNMYIMCNADNALRYSTNGTTFTLATLPGGYTGRPHSVIWVDKLNSFFAYGNTSTNTVSNIVLKSSDGVTWTQTTSNINFDAVRCGVRQ
jgi:hypothetical protein